MRISQVRQSTGVGAGGRQVASGCGVGGRLSRNPGGPRDGRVFFLGTREKREAYTRE